MEYSLEVLKQQLQEKQNLLTTQNWHGNWQGEYEVQTEIINLKTAIEKLESQPID